MRSALLGLVILSAQGQAAPVPGPPDESVTVIGRRSRFQPIPAPVPNARFDPPGSENALHDTDTGADLGAFGPAYSASTPVPPLNPADRGDLQDNPLHTASPH